MVTETRTMSFDELVMQAKIRHEDLNPVDRTSPMGKLRLIIANPDAIGEKTFKPEWAITSPGTEMFPAVVRLSEHAIRQLCSQALLDFNPRIMLENRARPDRVFDIVNDLFEDYASRKASFVRMVHGTEDNLFADARAMLSSKFTPLDDLEVLSVCGDYLKDAVVRYHGVTGSTSHFTATFPGLRRSDGVEPGIHIGNSEIGLRALTVQSVLFRGICSNVLPRINMTGDFGTGKNGDLYLRNGGAAQKGMVETGWRFVHVGDGDKLRDFVRTAIEESVRPDNPMLEAWDAGLQQKIDDPAAALERIAKLSRLAKEDKNKAVDAYAVEADVSGIDFAQSVTGVANAFTRAANDEDLTNEKRYALQVAGANAFKHLLN